MGSSWTNCQCWFRYDIHEVSCNVGSRRWDCHCQYRFVISLYIPKCWDCGMLQWIYSIYGYYAVLDIQKTLIVRLLHIAYLIQVTIFQAKLKLCTPLEKVLELILVDCVCVPCTLHYNLGNIVKPYCTCCCPTDAIPISLLFLTGGRYSYTENEKHTIIAVSSDNMVLTLNDSLLYTHISASETFGGKTLFPAAWLPITNCQFLIRVWVGNPWRSWTTEQKHHCARLYKYLLDGEFPASLWRWKLCRRLPQTGLLPGQWS